jgi:thymidylate synthase (FAD)
MKLIKASYEIITPINGEEILKQIELAARTCYKSEGKIEYEDWILKNDEGDIKAMIDYYAKSARALIPKIIQRGHEAMLEFSGNISVKFVCDRGVSHELVRHRLVSFAQECTRYCNYGNQDHIVFIIPIWCNIEPSEWTHEQAIKSNDLNGDLNALLWLQQMSWSEKVYNKLIKDRWSPQQARSVLPNSLKTEINMSANIREWRHILKLRTSNTAHPQMQELMRPLLKEFKKIIPILFDDINY